MKHDWMMDVLADLKTYALANGLPDVADHLEGVRHSVLRETSLATDGYGAHVGSGQFERHPEGSGNRNRA